MIQLNGDQLQPEFTALNPLQRIPVIIDEDVRVVESLAILDYLEAKYPAPALMPQDPKEIATVRMVEMAAIIELQPALIPLTKQLVKLEVAPEKLKAAQSRIWVVLELFQELLGTQPYFAGEQFTLAEVVAGTMVHSLSMFGIAIDTYPNLQAWSERLQARQSWQQTEPDPETIQAAIPMVKQMLETR